MTSPLPDDPRELFDLSGHTAVVTGASSGLGRAAASILAGAGAKVIGLARREAALQDWQNCGPGEKAIVVGDVSNRNRFPSLVEEISAPFGPPDILVTAAGVNHRQEADKVTFEGWDETLAINLTAPFFLAQALVPAMKKKKWGRILNFASLQSRRAFPGGIAYGASKGGVEQMTRAMAEAWSGEGINANAIAPGFFPTELTGPVFADAERSSRNAAQTCVGRNGTMDDIAGPVLFLCSESSRYITGQVLFVDGGFTAK